uniref:Uncharacterized protein n=1 Tax=Capitella teleta TaxID=283909 RepID=X2AIS4_CAPTE
MATTGSSGSPSQSDSSISRSGDEGNERYWRERCQSLEASLVKFKLQAAKIRELLADKEHETRTLEAENRARRAELTVRLLEERSGEVTKDAWRSPPLIRRLEQLTQSYDEREEEVAMLREQLEEQKSRRLHEAKLVEEKSVRIKEWVTQRIKKLEDERDSISLENHSLRGQMDSLRKQLQALPVSLSTSLSRQSSQASCSSASTCPAPLTPPIPQRPSSDILEAFRNSSDISPDLDITEDPDYQEVDEDRESKYAPKRHAPPQVRIERRVFPNPRLLQAASIVSSTGGSSEMLDRTDMVLQEATPESLLKPSSPVTPFPPPNSPLCPLTNTDHTVSALATLPRKKKEPKFFPSSSTDYASLTIDKRLRKCSPAHPRRAPATPPTPPLRRLPSWENRIYAIANKGIRLPDTGGCINRDSSCPVTDGLYAEKIYDTSAVPVFTNINGRAAQIRNTPFSGEEDSSSDSDDDLTPCSSIEAVDLSSAGPSKNSSTRLHQTQTSSGAVKRAVSSSHSVNSETSSDYAFPPEDDAS